MGRSMLRSFFAWIGARIGARIVSLTVALIVACVALLATREASAAYAHRFTWKATPDEAAVARCANELRRFATKRPDTVEAIEAHRRADTPERRAARARAQVLSLAQSRLHRHPDLDALAQAVADGSRDPYSAAEALIAQRVSSVEP